AGLCLAGKRPRRSIAPIEVVHLEHAAPVVFETEIEPILAEKCQVCHSGPVTKGDLDLGSYVSLIKGGKHWAPVVQGNSAASLLVRLAGRTERPFMPPRSEEPLSPTELALIKLWIDQGAKASGLLRAQPVVTLGSLPSRVHPVRALAISR